MCRHGAPSARQQRPGAVPFTTPPPSMLSNAPQHATTDRWTSADVKLVAGTSISPTPTPVVTLSPVPDITTADAAVEMDESTACINDWFSTLDQPVATSGDSTAHQQGPSQSPFFGTDSTVSFADPTADGDLAGVFSDGLYSLAIARSPAVLADGDMISSCGLQTNTDATTSAATTPCTVSPLPTFVNSPASRKRQQLPQPSRLLQQQCDSSRRTSTADDTTNCDDESITLKRKRNTESARQSRRRKADQKRSTEERLEASVERNLVLECENAVLTAENHVYSGRVAALEKQVDDLHNVLLAFGVQRSQQLRQQSQIPP